MKTVLPNPMTELPAAMRAASPPLDPPGPLVKSLGFNVTPKIGFEHPNELFVWGMLVRQNGTAPSCLRIMTIPASDLANFPRLLAIPTVDSSPCRSMCS